MVLFSGIEIYAQRPIKKGEEITISYTSLLSSNRERRALLRTNWCFDCTCDRCSDPTERGTNLGTLVCKSCGEAAVLMESPLAFDSSYACSKCDASLGNFWLIHCRTYVGWVFSRAKLSAHLENTD